MGPRRHPVPVTPGGFPLHTRGIQAGSSHLVSFRLDLAVTFWYAYVAPAVRRESGVEECGNTFGYTGAR